MMLGVERKDGLGFECGADFLDDFFDFFCGDVFGQFFMSLSDLIVPSVHDILDARKVCMQVCPPYIDLPI